MSAKGGETPTFKGVRAVTLILWSSLAPWAGGDAGFLAGIAFAALAPHATTRWAAPSLRRLLSIPEYCEGEGTRAGLSITEDRDPTASLGFCNILLCSQGKKSFLIPRWNFP